MSMHETVGGAAAAGLLFSLFLGRLIIPTLRRLKFGQEIRQDGPAWHEAKSGTPTMGGFIFGLPILVLGAGFLPFRYWTILLATAGFGLVGFLDDWLKIRHRRNEGLSARQKFAAQIVCAALFAGLMVASGFDGIYVFRPEISVTLPWLKWLLGALVLLSVTNAVNLTDGLDGLAASTALPVVAGLFFLSLRLDPAQLSLHAITAGALLGFLWYNRHPARVFMGDTGSLALGALIAASAISLGVELSLIILCGLFLLETVSVILQVLWFRFTRGGRLFRMAPLHHHFELGGWPEQRVVRLFFLVSVCLSLAGVFLFFWGWAG